MASFRMYTQLVSRAAGMPLSQPAYRLWNRAKFISDERFVVGMEEQDDSDPMSRVPRAAAAAAVQRLLCKSVRLLASKSKAVTTKKPALKSPICRQAMSTDDNADDEKVPMIAMRKEVQKQEAQFLELLRIASVSLQIGATKSFELGRHSLNSVFSLA